MKGSIQHNSGGRFLSPKLPWVFKTPSLGFAIINEQQRLCLQWQWQVHFTLGRRGRNSFFKTSLRGNSHQCIWTVWGSKRSREARTSLWLRGSKVAKYGVQSIPGQKDGSLVLRFYVLTCKHAYLHMYIWVCMYKYEKIGTRTTKQICSSWDSNMHRAPHYQGNINPSSDIMFDFKLLTGKSGIFTFFSQVSVFLLLYYVCGNQSLVMTLSTQQIVSSFRC